MTENFYITTAISYPNGPPHIGHAYEAIAADVIARFQRLSGRNVRFQTGTDEHGLKMAQKAEELGVTPAQLANEMSAQFIAMCDSLNISYDRFIRTSEEDHHRASQAIWQAMVDKGDMYLDRYEGWYSVRDEAFYNEDELIEGVGSEGQSVKLSPQGTAVEWTAEESWFFRLSKYQDRLIALYTQNPSFIAPESRRNEVMKFVEGGLRDLSVSRTSFDWGVKVPGSPEHVMYVWVDALTNYLTGLGYPDPSDDMANYWPANVHLIGKDITRFHAVYWPAFLMSADIALPKQVFAHGFLLNKGEKMSKSAGNVVAPLQLAEDYGVDSLRYFLMREVIFGNDGSFSAETIVNIVNADLANSFGNLAQRTLSMLFKNCDGKLLWPLQQAEADIALESKIASACASELPQEFAAMRFSQGIEAWLRAVNACNQYVDEQAPWALKKTDPERMHVVLVTVYRCLRYLALAISPVVPASATHLLEQLGVATDQRNFAAFDDENWYANIAQSDYLVAKPVAIFPRQEVVQAKDNS
ncbi:methionine--tRNA ligase [Parasphingorhabdus sp. DH2-15]|uniref:methionine--tRNA ligase n=1 Tax=Parasphingorhabdus sp. DH2-15 TaxID=3444112 RepID=UPI003F688462